MSATRDRITHVLLALVLIALVGVMAMLATGVYGGPLDPAGPPASTSSVRLPGTPIDPPLNPASFPLVISTPGHYYLTGNLNPPADTRAITISSSDVSLDLGGFVLTGSGSAPSVAGILLFGVQTRVEITHGRVRGFAGYGIAAGGSTQVVIDDVMVSESNVGITLGSSSLLRNCGSYLNTDAGVLVSGSNSKIQNCSIGSNAFVGLSLQTGTGDLVENSYFTNNNTSGISQGGITLNGMDGATLRDNNFAGNLTRDVILNFASDNNLVLDNTFECPTALENNGTANIAPINTADPGTNHTHKPAC